MGFRYLEGLVILMFVAILFFLKIGTELTFCGPQNFLKQDLTINNKIITVLRAETSCELKQGLMNTKELSTDGMLFVFQEESSKIFWMKNTLIPLSIAFIDKYGVIVEIQEMAVEKTKNESEMKRYGSKVNAKYALEVNLGFFKEKNIKIGDQFIIP